MNLEKNFKFYEKNGYVKLNVFNNNDINFFKSQIKKKINSIIKSKKIKASVQDLSKYHEKNFTKEIHNILMNPDTRFILLNKKIENKIFKKDILEILKKKWLHKKIVCSWIGDLKKKQTLHHATSFRIARPIIEKNNDAAGVHVDMNAGGVLNDDKNATSTLWVPIIGFNKKYSLRISPGSHKRNHQNQFKRGSKKISLVVSKNYEKKFKFLRLSLKQGQALLLHPNLLHGGSYNTGKNTRVSLDIRFLNLKNFTI